MNRFLEALTRMMPHSEEMPDISGIKIPNSYEEFLKWQCEQFNKTTGTLEGYDCPECLNRGYTAVIRDDVMVHKECGCMKARNSIFRLKKSGLSDMLKAKTFESYRTPDEWQKRAKSKTMQYANENTDKWLFFGGQSGCGKTHLCTAVCMKLINNGHDVKYVLWRDLIHYLESKRFNNENYNGKMQELQEIEVLYIDDFLKTSHKVNNKPTPPESDLNSAYEIINARAISGKRTIITSELHIADISALDEATGGRISEMSQGYQLLIKFDKNRNFRFYGEK